MKTKQYNRVACYIRVSTENQLENYSIEEQTERLKAYCKAKDWHIHKLYTDGGFSGGNTNRPALSQLLKDIKNHKIDMVIVYKLDRLSRSQKDTLLLIEDAFLKNNVEFVSMSENFDTSSPFGRAMIGILSVFAQLEKDQITERFTMGRIGRAKAGLYHGGSTIPLGYDYIDGKLVINEYETMQVKTLFEMFLKGYSLCSIRDYMHKKGYKTKYGNWTSSASVLQIIKNSIYIGKVKFKGIEYEGQHKPIINLDDFNKVQELIKTQHEDKKNSSQKTPFRQSYLLSSLLYCKRCGAKYVAAHGKYKCYSRFKGNKKMIIDPNCKNDFWKIEELDEVIINCIKRLKYDKEYFNNEIRDIDIECKKDINTIKSKISDIELQITKLIDLYQINNIPLEHITNRVNNLQTEKESLEKELTESSPKKTTKKDILNILDNLEKVLDNNDVDVSEKRMYISSLIKYIDLDGKNIDLHWRI